MEQTQQQIEHLRTIQETSSFWADIAENTLPLLAKDETLATESAAIKDKLDNIKLPDVDLSTVAKEETLNDTKKEILLAITSGGGAGITIATSVEYEEFKTDMQNNINELLNEGL